MSYPKSYNTSTYPVHVTKPTGLLKRIESLITPAQFRMRYLKGIQEVIFDNIGVKFSDEELKDYINRAINEAELALNIPIFAEHHKEKLPWDSALYRSWCFTRVRKGPMLSIEKLSIESAQGTDIFVLPADWIDMSQSKSARTITVIPLLAASGTGVLAGPVSSGGYAYVLSALGVNWLPAYWNVEYTAGICADAGSVPVVVNELIGTIAAQTLFSATAPLNMTNSVSLSQDGLGQSKSGPGNQLFALRQQELEIKKQTLLKQLRTIFTQSFYVSNI